VIAGKFFEGDNDEELAWKQHDVYHQVALLHKPAWGRSSPYPGRI
jgi:hypothetical protein